MGKDFVRANVDYLKAVFPCFTLTLYFPSLPFIVSVQHLPPVADFPSPCALFHLPSGDQ